MDFLFFSFIVSKETNRADDPDNMEIRTYPICFCRVSRAVENGDECPKFRWSNRFAGCPCTKQSETNKKKSEALKLIMLLSVCLSRKPGKRKKQSI